MFKAQSTPMLLLAAALITMSASSMAGLATTRAAFTDTAVAGSATFTTGTIDLKIQSAASTLTCTHGDGSYGDSGAAVGVLAALAMPTGVATGQTSPTGVKTIEVCLDNSGTLTSRYSMASTITENSFLGNTSALKSATSIRIHDQSSSLTAACTARLDSAGADVALGGGEHVLLATTTMNGTVTIAGAAGAPGTGTELATNTAVKICIDIVLPSTTSDTNPSIATTIQGKTITASAFTFTGTN